MSLSIVHNVAALDTSRVLGQTTDALTKSMQRLSSGYRINTAADDAAGLQISEGMRGQINGLAQAQRNIGDGISLVQTAEGTLDQVHSMLQRARDLSVQYKNGTLSASNQSAIQSEVFQLASEIERLGNQTKFNGICLLNAAGSVTFQVGANDGEIITAALISLGSASGVGAAGGQWFDLGNTAAISNVDAAINNVSAARAQYGAIQNRLEHTQASAATYQQNITAAESRIRDVDMASEMTNLTKEQVLQQAAMAMLGQANQSSQSVLSLLQR
jgi:flagellin